MQNNEWMRKARFYIADYGQLIFGSIQSNQSRIKGARKQAWEGVWSEDEEYQRISFYSYRALKKYQRKLRIISASAIIIVLAVTFLSFVQINYWRNREHIRDRILKKAGLESNRESITGAFIIFQIIAESASDMFEWTNN